MTRSALSVCRSSTKQDGKKRTGKKTHPTDTRGMMKGSGQLAGAWHAAN